MNEPSHGFGRVFTFVSLTITIVCTVVAFTTQWNQLIFVAMAFAVIPIMLTMAGGGDRPSDADVRWFVEGAMRSRAGTDTFSVRSLRPGMLSILYGRRGYIPVRLQVVVNLPLYKTAPVPYARFDGLTVRRIESIRRQVDQLVEALGAEAQALKETMPPDPFSMNYVVEKTPKGARLVLSCGVTFVPEGSTWAFSLEHLSWGRREITALGQPLASFPHALVLGAWGGDKGIIELLAAWKAFTRRVSTLQEAVENKGVDQGERAVRIFFRMTKAGTVFHGMGRSSSGQHEPAHFFLEMRSVDAAGRNVAFTMRNDGSWENARRFAGTVSYDANEKAVWVHGHTERGDAFADGGPLIGALSGFAMDLHFRVGPPAALDSFGGDVRMHLEEVSRAALHDLRASIYARRRGVAGLLRPGAVYVGRFSAGSDEGRVTLTFLEVTAGSGRMEAKLEVADWSGLFQVTEVSNHYADQAFDLALEPLAGTSASDSTFAPEEARWYRVMLSATENGFAGVAEDSTGPHELVLEPVAPNAGPARAAGMERPRTDPAVLAAG